MTARYRAAMAEETTEDALKREIYLDQVKCSFCGKRGCNVEAIVCGTTPDIAICSECVDLCVEIMAEERQGSSPATQ